MRIQRTYYCEGPGEEDGFCPSHASTATELPHLPGGFIEVRTRHDLGDEFSYFCGWDCLMKFAADHPLPIVIPWDRALGSDDGEAPPEPSA